MMGRSSGVPPAARRRAGEPCMRRRDRRSILASLCTLLVAAAVSARAQQPRRPDPNPDAFVEIEQLRVGIMAAGTAVGGGRLRSQGQEYSFSIRGLEFGKLRLASLSATGEVFNLRRLEDFAGHYEEYLASHSPGEEDEPEIRFLRNQAGVEVRLRTDRVGGQVRIAPTGVTIELR